MIPSLSLTVQKYLETSPKKKKKSFYCFVFAVRSCKDFSDPSSCLDRCSFVTLESENPRGNKKLEKTLENFDKLKEKQSTHICSS